MHSLLRASALIALPAAGCSTAESPSPPAGATIEAPAARPSVVTTRSPGGGLVYAWVPPGSSPIGCAADDPECEEEEMPRRTTTLRDGFWLATTEVPVGAFRRFAAETGHRTVAERAGLGGILGRTGWENRKGADWRSPGFPQGGRHPVVLVAWDDALAFCRWSGGRLPTEVEWEYAARGGLGTARYVWGDVPVPLVDGRRQANVADRSASGVSVPPFETPYEDGAAYTSPVGSFEPNAFGLHDMAGNVLEWTADSAASGGRVARGGAWNNPPGLVRVSRRSRFPASAALNILGFRCARDAAPTCSVINQCSSCCSG